MSFSGSDVGVFDFQKTVLLQSITFFEPYSSFSFEELRLSDYEEISKLGNSRGDNRSSKSNLTRLEGKFSQQSILDGFSLGEPEAFSSTISLSSPLDQHNSTKHRTPHNKIDPVAIQAQSKPIFPNFLVRIPTVKITGPVLVNLLKPPKSVFGLAQGISQAVVLVPGVSFPEMAVSSSKESLADLHYEPIPFWRSPRHEANIQCVSQSYIQKLAILNEHLQRDLENARENLEDDRARIVSGELMDWMINLIARREKEVSEKQEELETREELIRLCRRQRDTFDKVRMAEECLTKTRNELEDVTRELNRTESELKCAMTVARG